MTRSVDAPQPPSPPNFPPGTRLVWLDRARGLALVAMIIYHALWDGIQFNLITWTVDRALAMQTAAQIIAGSFLFISGLSLALAQATNPEPLFRRVGFWKRVTIIAAAAALVSVASFFAIPQAPIYFGILHHIAFATVLLALLAGLHPFWLVAFAGAVWVANANIAIEALNHPATIWLGLGTRAPVTADWVPLVPWLAAGLLGFALAKQFLLPWLASRPPQEPHATPRPGSVRADSLAFLGRHSLATYLIHQPIFFSLIYLYQWII